MQQIHQSPHRSDRFSSPCWNLGTLFIAFGRRAFPREQTQPWDFSRAVVPVLIPVCGSALSAEQAPRSPQAGRGAAPGKSRGCGSAEGRTAPRQLRAAKTRPGIPDTGVGRKTVQKSHRLNCQRWAEPRFARGGGERGRC